MEFNSKHPFATNGMFAGGESQGCPGVIKFKSFEFFVNSLKPFGIFGGLSIGLRFNMTVNCKNFVFGGWGKIRIVKKVGNVMFGVNGINERFRKVTLKVIEFGRKCFMPGGVSKWNSGNRR